MNHEALAEAKLLELHRRASPTDKLAAVRRINQTLIGLKSAHLAAEHPEWSAAERNAAPVVFRAGLRAMEDWAWL